MKKIWHIHFTDGRLPNCIATIYSDDKVLVDAILDKVEEQNQDTNFVLIPQVVQ